MSDDSPIENASRTERKWFTRTLVASFLSIIAYAGLIAIQFWVEKVGASLSVSHSSDLLFDDHLDKIHRSMRLGFWMGTIVTLCLVASGLFFLGSLIRWLFAVRARRAAARSIGS